MTTAVMENEVDAPDAVLVARVLDNDRDAFATIYDRYASQLFNFARAMLRNNEDASDAVADAFLKFAERLAQLRDPGKLRAWLYAIVRTECLHRLKSRKRILLGGDDHLADLPDSNAAPDEAVETAALRQLVWDAAAGLGERDRAILDLHLRHGLDGADLGDVMGVSVAHAHVMVDRLRKQMERSLGALLIAKTGRKQCADLDSSLTSWDGSFSPLVRKRVARHVDHCATCTARRALMVSPLALFGGVPAFAAPAELRQRVLSSGAFRPYPAPTWNNWLRRGILGTVGATVVVILSTVLAAETGDEVLVARPDDPPSAAAPPASTPPPSSSQPLGIGGDSAEDVSPDALSIGSAAGSAADQGNDDADHGKDDDERVEAQRGNAGELKRTTLAKAATSDHDQPEPGHADPAGAEAEPSDEDESPEPEREEKEREEKQSEDTERGDESSE